MYILLASGGSILHSALFLLLALPFMIDSIISTLAIYETYTLNFCQELKEGLMGDKKKNDESQKLLPKLLDNVEQYVY